MGCGSSSKLVEVEYLGWGYKEGENPPEVGPKHQLLDKRIGFDGSNTVFFEGDKLAIRLSNDEADARYAKYSNVESIEHLDSFKLTFITMETEEISQCIKITLKENNPRLAGVIFFGPVQKDKLQELKNIVF